MDYYNGSKGPSGPLTPTLFWGLGIENEVYYNGETYYIYRTD